MDLNIRIVDVAQSRNESVLKRIAYILCASAILFGPGILVDSAAMQWAGFVLFLSLTFAGTIGLLSKFRSLTIEEARAELDRLDRMDRE